jgi:polysaccharide transporter, PST family
MTTALMVAGALVLVVLAGFVIHRVFGPDCAREIGISRWAVPLSLPAGIEVIGHRRPGRRSRADARL